MAFYRINRMYRFELLVEIKARVIFMSHVEIVEINTTGVWFQFSVGIFQI